MELLATGPKGSESIVSIELYLFHMPLHGQLAHPMPWNGRQSRDIPVGQLPNGKHSYHLSTMGPRESAWHDLRVWLSGHPDHLPCSVRIIRNRLTAQRMHLF